MRRLLWLVFAAAVLAPAPVMAEIQWSFAKKDGRPYLRGFSGAYEGDDEFWARCRTERSIEIGVGADSQVGKGEGDAVRLTLTSAGKSATLQGQSRKSENFQMTAGTELRATISVTDGLFAVFDTGKPITMAGSSIKTPASWDVKGLKPRAAAFIKACGGR